MADVTDVAFRRMFARHGKPDITWTEFVSADGLFLRPFDEATATPQTPQQEIAMRHGIDPAHPLLKDLLFDETERPIVAQFFSKDPSRMRRAGALARDLGFDGVDINMGCPARVICNQGAGCAMIKTPELAQEIIRATQEGAGDLPVSVKTRTGYSHDETETWIPALLETKPHMLTLHARTRADMSKVPARWEHVARAVELRNIHSPNTLIVGNGDVVSREDALQKATETGADGIMVGRAIFGNPWFFNPEITKDDIPTSEILSTLVEHIELFEKFLGQTKNFALMKKHFASYLKGRGGIAELKKQLMQTNTSNEAISIIRAWNTKDNT